MTFVFGFDSAWRLIASKSGARCFSYFFQRLSAAEVLGPLAVAVEVAHDEVRRRLVQEAVQTADRQRRAVEPARAVVDPQHVVRARHRRHVRHVDVQ